MLLSILINACIWIFISGALNINSADLESLMQPLLSQISVGPLTAAVQAAGVLTR